MNARAVILAAGRSTRMGTPKVLLEYRGRPIIDRVIEAALPWEPLVVAAPAIAQALAQRGVEVVLNDAPERGMSHSLALADERIAGESPILVFLGDKPLVSAALARSILESAHGADVVYPDRDGIGGHPVFLSPGARRAIRTLPEGDTLRLLRGNPELEVRPLPTADTGAFFDVDEPADLAAG